MTDRDALAEYLTPIGFGVALFAGWEAAVRLFHIPLYIIPPPSAILVEYLRNFHRIWDYTLVTGMETLSGFAVSILLGVPLSMFVAFSPLLRRTFYPLAVTLEMVPKIVFAPIFVTWFGFGFMPKILIVFLVCFFPILLNGILAFTSLSLELTRFALSTGAGRLRTFVKVRLPAALPQLFVGIKGAAVNATVGATISEWIGGDAGLGYYVQIASGDLRMDLAFAIIIMLAALGLLLFWLVVLAERWLIPWHVSQRAAHGFAG
ncbi:MAG TPA: ABC transporter permease [Dongiaceae bacterium]|nr:ABC transporter permease [Dongiaceae bacterium]